MARRMMNKGARQSGNSFSDIITKKPSGKKAMRGMKRNIKRRSR
jgi:hypothetical protein